MYVNLPVFPGSESFSVVPVTCVLNCSIYRGHGEFSVEVGSTGEKRFDSKTRMWNGGWGGCGGKLKLCTHNWGIKQQKMQILCSFEEIALITSALLWVNLIQTPGVFRVFSDFHSHVAFRHREGFFVFPFLGGSDPITSGIRSSCPENIQMLHLFFFLEKMRGIQWKSSSNSGSKSSKLLQIPCE